MTESVPFAPVVDVLVGRIEAQLDAWPGWPWRQRIKQRGEEETAHGDLLDDGGGP